MKKIAFALLLGPPPAEQRCSVELIELDLPARVGADPAARYVVTVRQGLQESSLTATPGTRSDAERRALDFLRRRIASGSRLQQYEGFEAPVESVPPLPPSPQAPRPRGATVADVQTAAKPHIAALATRFAPVRWKLESPARRARAAWRVGECSDNAAAAAPSQRVLLALVPRLVELLGSGDDMLDLCLAAAIGRLGDRGAREAMDELAQRGRSPATCRTAHHAWLMLSDDAERRSHAEALLPGWQAELGSSAEGDALIEQLDSALAARNLAWPELLLGWYDVALVQAQARATLLRALHAAPLAGVHFQALRYVYKAAELRRDADVVGVLHARFENTPGGQAAAERGSYRSPATGATVVSARRGGRPLKVYRPQTREYLRLRDWRTLRRLATLGHSHAAPLAVALLLGLDDREQAEAHDEHRWESIDGRYQRALRRHHRGAGWLLVAKLLLPRLPGLQTSTRAKRWWTTDPIDTSRPFAQRVEGLQSMWDAHPEALLRLALESRSALVHAVVARALQDHAGFVREQEVPALEALLQSPYPPTAALGFDAVRARVEASPDVAGQVRWLGLLARSSQPGARDYALLRIAGDPAAYAAHAELVVALLLAADERVRRQGYGLALLAAPAAFFGELLAALVAADPFAPGLAEGAALVEQLLQGPLVAAAAEAAWRQLGSLLALLDHPAAAVVGLGVTWLLLHPAGLTMLPPPLLTRLLAAEEPERRASGVRLLAALPDEVLLQQADLIGELALHAHAGIRAAIAPALHRLAARDAGFARTLAERLHEALFRGEPGEGVHDDVLRQLTSELAAYAPARDPASVWRALQAQSGGAQRYGAWALAALQAGDFSLKQLATLGRHADVGVRQWAWQAIDRRLPATPSPEQAAELLPLGDALFDDTRAYAEALFGDRLPDESLSTELLIAWIDHPAPWLQALGRRRLVRRMSAADASLCLTRLSQHPSTAVQLFVTQWLLELPTDEPTRLAETLRSLHPYFLTVLSQVHRGRVAKSRVVEFLRAQVGPAEPAAVVAEIFARQVVTASLTDKPQFIAGLRDISARHPGIELPFMAWKAPAARAA